MEELKIVSLVLLSVLIVYWALPTALVRFGHYGAYSRLPKGQNRVALTFDDGPDPLYTPQILEVLDQYQVKAGFFVTGEKALAYPHLIRQIAAAGHCVGNHGLQHKAVWLLGPWATINDITETDRILTDILGEKPVYYRSPWGLFNLVSLLYFRLRRLPVVLWTYMSWDWTEKATVETVNRRVLNKLHDGTIIILHDSSSFGAAGSGPQLVIRALPELLQGIAIRNLRVVPLLELGTDFSGAGCIFKYATERREEANAAKSKKDKSGFRLKERVAIPVWSFADRVIRLVAGITDTNAEQSFFRIARRCYRGKNWLLSDGTLMEKGDLYMEIHINNEYLRQKIGENATIEHMTVTAMQEIHNAIPELAGIMMNDPAYHEAKMLLGITLLHRGGKRFGFTSYEIKPDWLRRLIELYEGFILTLFYPSSNSSHRKKLTPKYIVITRSQLLKDCKK